MGLIKKEDKKIIPISKSKLPDTIEELCSGKDEYIPPLEDEKYIKISYDLKRSYAKKILDGLKDDEIKQDLIQIVLKNYQELLSQKKEQAKEQANYAIQELVGTGRIGIILSLNKDITDVGWNGTHLSLETNDEKVMVLGEKLKLDNLYMERVIQKYARMNNKEFNESSPILDGMFGNVRLNAIHSSISPDGATFSLRITRPRLALNEENFQNFAPLYILELLEKIVKTNANIFISGEVGTGKTELQKLLLSYVPTREKVLMIEDVRETHAKKLFPAKDIYSWITTKKTTISDLVSACLRNNPRWIIISEVRGAEAYEMMQAVLSGHKIITTLHAVNAHAIPTRFANMCSIGYSIDEQMLLNDFRRYVEFGIHIERLEIDGSVIRYLAELVEYKEEGINTIFKQSYNGLKKEFEIEYNELSDEFKKQMVKRSLTFHFEKVGVKNGES